MNNTFSINGTEEKNNGEKFEKLTFDCIRVRKRIQ